ncbi:MAG: phage tail protein [Anaerolineae bacterium]|nr:phage tail protein [Anaerolineae bacterium]
MMDNETNLAVSTTRRQIDSLSANEFAVELDGVSVTGIFRVTGLIPFKLDVKPTLTKRVRDPFKLTKMVQRDPENPFNKWVKETVVARDDIVRPTRQLAVIAVDDGTEIRRWFVKDAWIAEVSYSDFNSGSSELIEETLVIYYEDIEEHWIG